MSNAIFDLEQQILQCWNVVDDLKMLVDSDGYDNDDIKAVCRLYQHKFDQCFRTFESVCREYHQANKAVQEYTNKQFMDAMDKIDAEKSNDSSSSDN